MENTDPIFVSGLYLNRVSDKAPAFIITNQDIHVEKLIAWLQANRHLANERGYIKITGKESQTLGNDGLPKRYFQVDTWKKEVTPEVAGVAEEVPQTTGNTSVEYPEQDGKPPF